VLCVTVCQTMRLPKLQADLYTQSVHKTKHVQTTNLLHQT